MKGIFQKPTAVRRELSSSLAIENAVLESIARAGTICSDRLLELIPVVADETTVYETVERLQCAGLIEALPGRDPDAPRFIRITLTERGRTVVGS